MVSCKRSPARRHATPHLDRTPPRLPEPDSRSPPLPHFASFIGTFVKASMRNLKSTSLIFELSKPGRRGAHLPKCDVPVPELSELLPAEALATEPLPLPEVAEPEVVRHFTNLSTLNMSVDTHFYPLGSCTMKYNSKRNERIAGLPGLADLHPYQPESTLQGILQLFHELQQFFGEISGLP